MRVSHGRPFNLLLITIVLSGCPASKAKPQAKVPEVTVALVQSKAVTLTEQYSCQLRSHHHIDIKVQENGYIDAVAVKERQTVKQGDVLFQINYKKLFENKNGALGASLPPDVNLEKTRASVEPAMIALGVVAIKAPFGGVVDRLSHHVGSVVLKGETLTTLSDNSQMWAYFSVSEARYLEFKATNMEQHTEDLKIELVMANGKKFDQPGRLGAIGADFHSETGTIQFRADFLNPDHLLRHGQRGTVLISRMQNDAIVVPQRATFEIGLKRYVHVVDKDDVAHQREIVIQGESDDMFVVKSGVDVGDRIVVDGARLVRDGDVLSRGSIRL